MGRFGKSRLRKGISIVAAMVLLLSSIMPTVPVFATSSSYVLYLVSDLSGEPEEDAKTLTLNLGDGVLVGDDTNFLLDDNIATGNKILKDENSKVALPSATLDDREFDGWYTYEYYSTRAGGAGDLYKITADKTLYAIWTCSEGVAQIGNDCYNTFEDAVNSADGKPIVLLADVSYTMTSENQSIKVYKNGHDITVEPFNENCGVNIDWSTTNSNAVFTYTNVSLDNVNYFWTYDYPKGTKVTYGTMSSTTLSTNGTYKLLKDASLSQRLVPGTLASNITLDLNGYTLTSTADDAAMWFGRDGSASSHKVYSIVDNSVNKGGKIIATGLDPNESSDAIISIFGKYNDVTIGEGVILSGGAITIFGNDNTLDFYGTVNGGDDFAIATNGSDTDNPTITINEGASLSSNSIAVYFPSEGTLSINGGTIEGSTAVYVKAGTTTIGGGTLVGNGEKADYVHNGNGANPTGDGLVVESCNYPGGIPTVNINGGTITSLNNKSIGYYIYEDNEAPTVISVTNEGLSLTDGYEWMDNGEGGYNVSEAVQTYTITWTDHSGSTTGAVAHGVVPSHADAEDYVEGNRNYTFSEWTPELTGATADTEYTAVYETGECIENYHPESEEEGAACVAEKTMACVEGEDANANYTAGSGAATWSGDAWVAPTCEKNGCKENYHPDEDQDGLCVAEKTMACVEGEDANANYIAGSGAATWSGDAWVAPTCEKNGCKENYHPDEDQDGLCVAEKTMACVEGEDANANYIAGSGAATWSGDAWVAPTCEKNGCKENYHPDEDQDGLCVAEKTMACVEGEDANANYIAGSGAATWSGDAWVAPTCEKNGCKENYHPDEDQDGLCVAEKTMACVEGEDANANYTAGSGAATWSGDAWVAPVCEFASCETGYTVSGGVCEISTDEVECDATDLPEHAIATNPTVTVSWDFDKGDYADPAACEWTACETGYTVSGGVCVTDTQPEDVEELVVPDPGTTASAGGIDDISLDNAEATTGFDANDYAGVTTPQIIIQQKTDDAALHEEGTSESALENTLTVDFVTDTRKVADMQGIIDIQLIYLDGSGNATPLGNVVFSDPVKIMIPVKAGASNVEVRVKHDGDASYGTVGLTLNGGAHCNADGTVQDEADAYTGGDVPVVNGKAEIYTCSASSFVAYTETDKQSSTPSGGSSGGSSGGGSSKTTKTDDAKATTGDDAATTEVDETNETNAEENNGENAEEQKPAMTEAQAVEKFGQEQIDAYKWALENGITTMKTVEAARLDEPLTRAELAKMMVVYIQKVVQKDPILTGDVTYKDVDESLGDLFGYIKLAYQYQIMGINADGTPIEFFNPNGIVSRGEYATVFSRVLFGAKFNKSGDVFYTNHLEALKTAGILTNTLPSIQEMRGWVMLMMYRSSQNGEAIEKVVTATEENKDETKAEETTNAESTTGGTVETPTIEEKSETTVENTETTAESTTGDVTEINTGVVAEVATGDAASN